jgi:hypothetical protein
MIMFDIYDDILKEQGFVKIGALFYRIIFNLWWHPQVKMQILHIPVGSKSLIKGCKSYFLKSIAPEGETWARDIGPLQDYLENHFRELHISFSYFRDITPTLAALQINRKFSAETTALRLTFTEDLAQIQRRLAEKQVDEQNTNDMLSLDTGTSDLLQSYMKRRLRSLHKEKTELEEEVKNKKEQVTLFNNLQKEYQRKGSAACFNFSLSSNIQMAQSPLEFRDALASIIKEIKDAHRYQVSQKLCGKLNINIAEADEPAVVWLEEWSGGALSPSQMERFKNGL